VLRTDELDFELPEELIATTPAEPRDAARMLVVSRTDPRVLEHRQISDLPEYLRRGDLMVVNSTRVIAARFVGARVGTGGKLPGLYLGPGAATPEVRRWLVLIKGGHLHPGVRLALGDGSVQLELIERSSDEPGAWLTRVHGLEAGEGDAAALERVGMTPLPPYILQARKRHDVQVPETYDRARYQTVYADAPGDPSHPGSVAAPTAGMHLTPELLQRLDQTGVRRAEVILHVGTGTFKPVETEFLQEHRMHEERCSVAPATADAIAAARAGGGRVLCVGTTTARALESFAALPEASRPAWLDTTVMITPGHQWRSVDMMLTNFHLPRSTLLAMVASLFEASGGLARLKEIYRVAVGERYRFFSYGDAMLVLP
jgi:S-adenosylmethionine:tRNA ribosyltransferase-isomerase